MWWWLWWLCFAVLCIVLARLIFWGPSERLDIDMSLIALIARIGGGVERNDLKQFRKLFSNPAPAFVFGEKIKMQTVNEVIASVNVRRYIPTETTKRGTLVWIHGGGWVLGDLESHDHVCRLLAKYLNREVLSIDYRCAPEHRFPSAVDDCLAVTRAIVAAASPATVAIGGDSAGGNLAAVVARRLRVEANIKLAAQLLVYPATDLSRESKSYEKFASGYILSRESTRFFIRTYIPDMLQRSHPDASPLLAAAVDDLPPARIVLSSCDVLHDEGRAYALKLSASGVEAVVDEVVGVPHGFFNLLGFEKCRLAVSRAAEWLDQHLHSK